MQIQPLIHTRFYLIKIPVLCAVFPTRVKTLHAHVVNCERKKKKKVLRYLMFVKVELFYTRIPTLEIIDKLAVLPRNYYNILRTHVCSVYVFYT